MGTQATLRLESAPRVADQVVADVRFAGIGISLGDTSRQFDAFERNPHLCFTARLRQFLDRMSVAIAAAKVHPAVDAGRIAMQDVLDETDALEEFAPVER